MMTPWATEEDLDDKMASPAHTCHNFGQNTFIRGCREVVDVEALRAELARHVSVETLHGAFRSIDVDGKGTITPAQYRRIFDNLAPHVPKAVSSQIMLLGADPSGLVMCTPLFRALGLELGSPEAKGEHQPLRITPSRAKGTNGDIIAHRDDDQFESVEASRSERTNAMAATTSGDIIGHTSPLRSADVAWTCKGRVMPDGSGSVLAYSHPDINTVHEHPQRYSRYRNAGDIIANADRETIDPTVSRPMFPTRTRKFY